MDSDSNSLLLLEKLGHSLVEIRLRALASLQSKVNNQTINLDINCKRLIINKLFGWFDFDECPQQNEVLELIIRFLKDEEQSPFTDFEKESFSSILKSIIRKINPEETSLIDEIKNILFSFKEKRYISRTLGDIKLFDDALKSNLFESPSDSLQFKAFPIFVFPIVDLINTDLHILESVAVSLSNSEDIDTLCDHFKFFTNVILQDFPAEVFLQRSSIIKIFLNILNSNNVTPNKKLLINLLECLNKFCDSIRKRILYFTTSSLISSKQIEDINEEIFSNCKEKNKRFINDAYFNFSPNHSNPSLNEESEQLRNVSLENQFTLEDFCLITLELSLKHIPQTIHYISIVNSLFLLINNLMKLFCNCVNKEIWKNSHPIAIETVNHLLRIFKLFGEILEVHSNFEYDIQFHNFIYIQIISHIMYFINNLIPYEHVHQILPTNIKMRLIECLFNPILKIFYKPLYDCIENISKNFDLISEKEMFTNYLNTISIDKSMKYSNSLIKNFDSYDLMEIITSMNNALPSLSYLKNIELINNFFNYLFKKILWSKIQENDKEQLILICLKLLSHSDNLIKVKAYENVHSKIISLLGVKTFDKEAIEPLINLMDKSLLVELIIHGLTHNDKLICKMSTEIIMHLLKGKILMTDNLWKIFMINLIPVIPLLICHANNNTLLGKTIIRIFDPDVARSIMIPEIEILKGNILLLFSSVDIRKEAIIRIIWILSNEQNSTQRMPNLSLLDLEISSNLCIINEPSELIDSESSFYEESNLTDILNTLSLDDQSELKYSSLLHLSSLLENKKFHESFLQFRGLERISSLLKEFLYIQNNNHKTFTPLIIIIKKLSSFDSQIRQKLSSTNQIYFDLLRVLFLLCGDETIKQNISIILFLLICSNWLIMVPKSINNKNEYKLSLPYIFENLSTPFQSLFHWRISLHSDQSLYDILMSNNLSKKYLRIMWTLDWFEGVNGIKDWKDISSINSTQQLEIKKFNSNLFITENDLKLIHYSILNNLIEKHLYNIQNSTNHKTVLNEITYLYGYLSLLEFHFISDFKENINIELINLPWETTFSRFLKIPPNSSDDKLLVLKIVDFIKLYINTFFNSQENYSFNWVSNLIKNTKKPLSQIVQNSKKMTTNYLSFSILILAQQLVVIENYSQENILNKLISEESSENSWIGFITIIIENLKYFNKQHFYNLALISKLLSSLMWLTKESGWSQTNKDLNKSSEELWIQLIKCLKDIIIAFICGNSNMNSFMGIDIIRSALICLINLFVEIKSYGIYKNCEYYWTSAFGILNNENLEWLISLLENRDIIIRASTLHLISDFASTREGCLDILPKLNLMQGALWKICLNFLIDHNEACIIREQSALLFINLLKNITYIPLTCEIKKNEKKLDSIFEILEDFNFFKELLLSISFITFETNILNAHKTIHQLSLNSPESESNLSSNSESLHLNPINRNFTTPWFVKTFCWILIDLIEINPTITLENIKKFNIIPTLFRSFQFFPEDIMKEDNIIEDTFEFYFVICEFFIICINMDKECIRMILNNSSSIYTLLNFVNLRFKGIRDVSKRNYFWGEIFNLLACLLNSDYGEQSYNFCLCAFQNLNFFNYLESLIDLTENLCEDVNIFYHLALLFEFDIKHLEKEQSDFSFAKFLSIDEELLNRKNPISNLNESNKNILIIKKFCKILFQLFEKKILQKKKFNDNLSLIALINHLIGLSKICQSIFSQMGLLEIIMIELKEIQNILSIETTHKIRNPSEKKKLTILFDKVRILFGLLTNLIYNNESNKLKLIEMNLSNVIHNLWVWIQLKKSVFITSLKMLLTFTCNSLEANQSLSFVTNISGGITKRFSTNSVIHCIITYIVQSMHMINPPEELEALEISFNILKNAIHTFECRGIIIKSTLFHLLNKFFPQITKNQNNWIKIQIIWLKFIQEFTFYPEGQIMIPKIPEILELFHYFVSSNNSIIKENTILIMRNISFHPYNRIQLLSSDDYLSFLNTLLNNGTIDEQYIGTTIIWALISNNHKGKQQIKVSKLINLLKKNYDYLILSKNENEEYKEILEYVIKILK